MIGSGWAKILHKREGVSAFLHLGCLRLCIIFRFLMLAFGARRLGLRWQFNG